MQQYLKQLKHVLNKGVKMDDRTGTGTISYFGMQERYDLRNGRLPLVTTKKVFTAGVVRELLWMLSGSTNINPLKENNVNIWNEWADDKGDLGPVYGEMWRKFPAHRKMGMGVEERTVDQIRELEHELDVNPLSRRLVVSGWHPGLLPDTDYSPSENAAAGKQALPPCHTLFQFKCEPMTTTERVEWHNANIDTPLMKVGEKGMTAEKACDRAGVPKYFLSCQLYQRSGDLFLGVPFNIASYALLTHMLCQVHNFAPKEFIHTLGDAHIYQNHVDQVKEQLKRKPTEEPVTVHFNEDVVLNSILDIDEDMIEIRNYNPQATIKAPVAV